MLSRFSVDRWCELLLVAVTLIAALACLPDTVKTDDAFITLRYARNLADGHGFVFNPGEHHLGTTSPLFAIGIAGVVRCGVDPLIAASALHVVAVMCLGLVGAALVGPGPRRLWSWSFALLFAVQPVVQFQVGMETSLYTAVGFGCVWLAVTDRRAALGAACVALGLLRPDGAALVLLLLGYRAARARAMPWRELAVMALVASPWLVYSVASYGSPLSATAGAKVAQGESGLWNSWLSELLPTLGYGFVVWLAVAALGAVIAWRDRRAGPLLIGGWLVLNAGGFVLSGVPAYGWYYIPTIAQALFLATYGAISLVERLLARTGQHGSWLRPAVVALLAAAIGGFELADNTRSSLLPGDLAPVRDRYQPLGRWLERSTPDGASVLALEVGILGYYSRRSIVDLLGLVTPGLAEHVITGDHVARAMAEHAPDYALSHPRATDGHEGGLWDDLARDYTQVRSLGDSTIWRRVERSEPDLAEDLLARLPDSARCVLFTGFPTCLDTGRFAAEVARRRPALAVSWRLDPSVDTLAQIKPDGALVVAAMPPAAELELDAEALARWQPMNAKRIEGSQTRYAVHSPAPVLRGRVDVSGPLRRIIVRMRVENIVGAERTIGALRWTSDFNAVADHWNAVTFPVTKTDALVDVEVELPRGRFCAEDRLDELLLMPIAQPGVVEIESIRIQRW